MENPNKPEFYNKLYDGVWEIGRHSQPYEYEESTRIDFYNQLARLPFFEGRGRILDVGCGMGGIFSVLPHSNGLKKFGIDFSHVAIEKIKQRIPAGNFVVGDVHTLPFEPGYFQKVICTETLEHVDDPSAVIAEIFRVLKTNGELLITVPEESLDLPAENWPGGISVHINKFSVGSLTAMVHRNGFRIDSTEINEREIWLIATKPEGTCGRRRAKTRHLLADVNSGMEVARMFYGLGNFLEAFDLYEQLADTYPEHAIPILAEAFDRFNALPEKENRYHLYQARYFDFDIRPSDRILDIGSGNLPFPFATHLADLSLSDGNVGRAGEPFRQIEGRQVYECNIEDLPFSDKEFDFVYCSHVLEHVNDPEKACRELMRVGKRGYIETPTRGKDLWLNTAEISNHRWAVELIHDRLVFTEYTPEEISGIKCDLLLNMHCNPQTQREKAFSALIYLKADLINTMYCWEDEFSIEVRRLGTTPDSCPEQYSRSPHSESPQKQPADVSIHGSFDSDKGAFISTPCLNIYADTLYRPPGRPQAELLHPFWGIPPNQHPEIDDSRFDRFMQLGKDFFRLTKTLDEADIAVFPGHWEPGDQNALRLAEIARNAEKPLLLFYNEDSVEPIHIPGSIIFRTSFYRSRRLPNEFAMPAWSEDFITKHFAGKLPVRDKNARPTVGFCGYVPPEQGHVRKRAVDILKASTLVDANLIVRDRFWAGALGDEVRVIEARREFIGNMIGSDYNLCLRGAGNFSYRLYETLSCGRIPVFIDTDCVLPHEDFIDWKNYCVFVDEGELAKLDQQVADFHASLTPDGFIALQHACRRLWQEWLSPEGFFANLHRYVLKGGTNMGTPARRDDIRKDAGSGGEVAPAPTLLGEYEPEVCRLIEQIVQPGWTCADIGAHQGNITARLAHAAGANGRVLAFEAAPENCEILRMNMRQLGLASRVTVENAAVADGARDHLWLYHGRNSSSFEWNIVGHDVDGNVASPYREIKAISLDGYFPAGSRLDFVKIDVEGAAGMVFTGMRRLLREARPVIFTEFHDDNEWKGRGELLEAGYTLHDINGRVIDLGEDTKRVYQCLAVPRSAASGKIASDARQFSPSPAREAAGQPDIIFINTYYQAFLDSHYRAHPQLSGQRYDEQVQSLLATGFGDSDFYSEGLKQAGWSADNLIVNCSAIQQAWARDNRLSGSDLAIAVEQIRRCKPQVVYLQDLGIATSDFLAAIRPHVTLIVGQIASPIPPQADLSGFDIIISSFPHFVARLRQEGITAYYQPLAFDPVILDKIGHCRKSFSVTFVGGISPAHGKGTELLEQLARLTPLEFWGYGADTLASGSPITDRHHGEIWGLEMFRLLAQSGITINRHIDVAENNANNMRLFEATGCGALLITDYKDNLNDLFEIGKEVVVYRSVEECASLINYYLAHPGEAEEIAKAGQARTLRDHTYGQRMTQTAEILARHLRYRNETNRFAPFDTAQISYGHTPISPAEITLAMTSAWQNDQIPKRQRALVQHELNSMYQGKIPLPFQVLADILRPFARPGLEILEIGCASGYYYEALEYLLNTRLKYTGADYSPPLVTMARDYYPHAAFHVADGASLPFPDVGFKVVISSCVLLHVPNYLAHIAETVRVAREMIVFHRTPVCRNRPTNFMKKFAYGVETLELIFNENELLSEFAARGLSLTDKIEYHANPDLDEYGITYLLRRNEVSSELL